MSEGLSPREDKLARRIGQQRKSSGEAVAAALQSELDARAQGKQPSRAERAVAGLARKMHASNEKAATQHFTEHEAAYRAQALKEARAAGVQINEAQPGERAPHAPAAGQPTTETHASPLPPTEAEAQLGADMEGLPQLEAEISGIASWDKTAAEMAAQQARLDDETSRARAADEAREVIDAQPADPASEPEPPTGPTEADLVELFSQNGRGQWRSNETSEAPDDAGHSQDIIATDGGLAVGAVGGNVIHNSDTSPLPQGEEPAAQDEAPGHIGRVMVDSSAGPKEGQSETAPYRDGANRIIDRALEDADFKKDFLSQKDLGRDYSEEGITRAMAAAALPYLERAQRAQAKGQHQRAEAYRRAGSDEANALGRAMKWTTSFDALNRAGMDVRLGPDLIKYKTPKKPPNALKSRGVTQRLGLSFRALRKRS